MGVTAAVVIAAATANNNMASSQLLPQKEQSLFKQVVKFYEQKQYKKGLKAADQVLKKFPEHGETLAMKGLTIRFLDKNRKEEVIQKVNYTFRVMNHDHSNMKK